ncbi:MAG: cobyric acid synthase [Deltaproteobacteria bacterium]|nr:cobyric acid synthase [Deltaproteobacteria bacterium]
MLKVKKNIMLQGTSSHVGKTVLTAALLRCLVDRGFKCAPFKAQNMALNSAVSSDGGEIGRAQAFQAEAAGIPSSVHMNPVLLKPTGEARSQVIIQGRVHSVMSAAEYHKFKPKAMEFVLESYRALSSVYDVIVIEGAGSPAEINLREGDIANMGIAEAVDSPVLLVGDIDRGGVFASLVGTLELLSESERARVKGFIINKFRGDKTLLMPGLDFLEERTGKKVFGVVPHFSGLVLPDEDSVGLENNGSCTSGRLKVSVIKLPRISNYTDFDPLKADPGLSVVFAESPSEIEGSALVIIPGTKSTIEDLLWLHEKGLAAAIQKHAAQGASVFGICGGFQILGKKVSDPFGVESGVAEAQGLGLLDVETVLNKEKSTFQVSGTAGFGKREFDVKGYEIHMGESIASCAPFAAINERNGEGVSVSDGGASADGRVCGTYIHGIFDNDGFRNALFESLGARALPKSSFSEAREASLSELARLFEESVEMEEVLRAIGL